MVLVTGGTGLVGSFLLLDLVRSGEKIRAIYRTPESISTVTKIFSYSHSLEEAQRLIRSIDWVQADIIDIPALEKAFDGVKKVYHCAALISFDPAQDYRLRKINIEGTANVVNFCISKGVEKLCFLSSIATLDKKPGEEVISETSQWVKEKDHNMYAITKYGAEMEVWRASQEGVPVVILNPGIILGPGHWDRGSGKLFRQIQKGLKFHFPKITGFVGVNDVVTLLQELMETSIENEQFVVISENISFKDVLNHIAEVLEQPSPNYQLKPWMVNIGWLFETAASFFSKKERKLNRSSARSLFEDAFYSNQKIISCLDYKFQPIQEVITETGMIFKKEITK